MFLSFTMTKVISLKVDEITKKQAQELAARMGLSLNSVLKVFLKQFIRTKRINIDLNIIPPEVEEKWIAEEKEALKNSKKYDNVDCLIDDCLN